MYLPVEILGKKVRWAKDTDTDMYYIIHSINENGSLEATRYNSGVNGTCTLVSWLNTRGWELLLEPHACTLICDCNPKEAVLL